MPVINPSGASGSGTTEPCGWSLAPGATGCCTGWDDYTPQQQETATTLASVWMWAATGRIYGQCETLIEVCADVDRLPTWREAPATAYPLGYSGLPRPYLAGGVWWNGPAGGGLCCNATCDIHLPGFVETTGSILEVTVAGETLDPAAYQVYDHDTLARIDGQCWPVCCKASADTGVTVHYLDGQTIPLDVRLAAGILACEFAAACAGDECRLPRRVAQLSQMGTTVSFADLPGPGSLVMALGIDEIDQVVKARNPYAMTQQPQITNPNRRPPRQPV